MKRLGAVLAAAFLALAIAGPVAAGRSGDVATHYYLSLGDSLAAGQQPIGDASDLYRTSDGYADQLYAIARDHYPKLQLVKLGCPGETTVTMVEGGTCAYDNGSQLAEALDFLHAHAKYTSLITIDIGWNDFPRTLEGIPEGVASVQAHLPGILAALRQAAPDVPIVGMTIYDPYLAFWLPGPAQDQSLATDSVAVVAGINDMFEGIYGQFGIPVADVESAFFTTDFTDQISLPGVGDVPLNVATICVNTWMCAPAPYGPDNHANHDGYHAIALAFASALGW